MANRILPEGPLSFGPSEKDIEDFRHNRRRRSDAAPATPRPDFTDWQREAEARGFASPIAMAAHGSADAGRPDALRLQERRLQEEFTRRILPGTAPHPETAGEVARPHRPRPWDAPFTAAQQQGVNRIYQALAAGRIADRRQAEAEIDAVFADAPARGTALARQLKQALTPAFDASGAPRRWMGGGDGTDSFRDLTLQAMRNGHDDPQEEIERRAFANLERSGHFLIDPSADGATMLVRRAQSRAGGPSVALALSPTTAFAVGDAGARANPGLDALLAFAESGGSAAAVQRLEDFLPRERVRVIDGRTIRYVEKTTPDPEALAQLQAAAASARRGDDAARTAAALVPVILHEALEPRWARIGIEALVALSPLGTAIDTYESFRQLQAAARNRDTRAGLVAASGLAILAVGLIPGGRLFVAGDKVADLGRKTYRLDDEAARELLANTENVKEVVETVRSGFNTHFAREGGRKSNAELVRKRLPKELRERYSEADIDRLNQALIFQIIPRAAEIEVVNFLTDVLRSSKFAVDEQIKTQIRPGLGSTVPDIRIRPRNLTETELANLADNFIENADALRAAIIEIKTGFSRLNPAQRRMEGAAQRELGDYATTVFNVPHHRLSPEAYAQAVETYHAKNGLPGEWTKADIETVVKALQGRLPPETTALEKLALTLVLVGLWTAASEGGEPSQI